jgi:putative phosphoesterase
MMKFFLGGWINVEKFNKIAYLTDIHGNAEALKEVLKDIQREEVQHIVCGGDLIGIGYQSSEVINYILDWSGSFLSVTGNHDEAILALKKGAPHPKSHAHAKEHHQWLADRLTEKDVNYLASLPRQHSFLLGNKKVLVTHYAFKKGMESHPIDFDPFERIQEPSLKNMKRLFSSKKENIILFGHHHPSHEFNGQKLYLNPGALGCQHVKKACYYIIEEKDNNVCYQRKEIEYDWSSFLNGFERLKVPERKTLLKIFYGVE